MTFFDSDLVEDTSFTPLDPDWYPAVIVYYDYRLNKAGTGKILEIEYLFTGGKKVRSFYNLQHKNEVAANIGRSEFKRVCVAVDIPKLQTESSLQQLVGKKLAVKLGIREYEGKEYNEVISVSSIENFPEFKSVSINDRPKRTTVDTDDIPF